MADAPSTLPLNVNQENTRKYSYKKEIVSEINDTKEISEVTFPINLKLIKQHQQKYLILMDKYKEVTYQKGTFSGVSNIDLNHIPCEDNIVIPPILKSYILHWYHTYILH